MPGKRTHSRLGVGGRCDRNAMPTALNPPRSAPAWMRRLLAVQALCAALYALLLTGAPQAVGVPLEPNSWWPIGVIAIVSALACGGRAAARRQERGIWWLLAAGLGSWSTGFIVWAALYENDANPPYPSVADALWFPFMVLLLVALAAVVRAERPNIAPVTWLDALIPAFAVSAVTTQLLLPHISTSGKPLAEQVTLLAYPAVDILLIVVAVLMLALRRWEPGARWALLSVAVMSLALADLIWSYLVATGAHEVGAAADIPYLMTPIALAWAAWVPPAPVAAPDDDRLKLALPAAAALCSLGLLFYGGMTGDLIVPALALAVAAVSTGVVRWWLALRREAQAAVFRQVADELARKADQQAAVADLGRRAIATDVDELMRRATEVVASILRAQRVGVAELAPGTSELIVRADSGGDESDLQALCLDALDAGAPTVVVRDALCARIERKDGSWGVIVVENGGDGAFGDDDTSFVQAVANVLGAAVARAREEQLEAQLQQSRRLESVGKLAGGIAHDFNNLLAIIQGYADFAREAATDDQQRHDLEELSKAAARGAELVRQLLLFSRRKPVEAIALDIAEVVRDTEPMLRQALGEGIELRCWLVSELPPVLIDPGQVTQVLVNLAVNARDAMPDGGTLTIKGTRTEGGDVRLTVEDTGAGMDEETVAKAFDPFFTTKPPGSGTGLGLASVYGIVTQANGTIELQSTPGGGTCIVVELPQTEGAALAPRPRAEPPTPEAGEGETILVVEDDEEVRGVAGRILRQHGYQVVEAAGGEEALELAARETGEIDLLVTDVVMPGMNGPELAERLRELQPGVRVLHMSGYTAGIGSPHPGATLSDLIEKPFTGAELLERVRKLLGRAELSATSG
ncbi:MAG: two-component system, cell cycle sensor histidine kinase and response regulator CckA [Thermoleophilaceae bacterium]|nr:two-component system, cell cycle sensor histidine kinase and response regulator CckA [Thermoleophilaceae bacterium]